MNLTKLKKIHFIGIGGIGVSSIAKMMLSQDKVVAGSDLELTEITQELKNMGAKIFQGHKSENLAEDTELIIYSPAVPEANPELTRAKELNIPQLSYPEFLGELSKDKFTIAVSGTNGKTTTTAMLGLILEKAGLDPTVIVGSKVNMSGWQGNLRMGKPPHQNFWCGGKSKYFVVEGCEWRAHMLNLKPKVIVLTNIEEDHLDYYRDLNHIIETFQKYVDKLPSDGLLVLNADDVNSINLKRPKCKVITYGIKNPADITTNKFSFKLKVPGIFNIYNALAAGACALNLGVKREEIKKALEDFTGLWRRFERVGERDNAIIISDYAHHPTAVKGTILAAKEFYPDRRIVAVFQPHHHNRTKNLFNDFVASFDRADLIILAEIYDVAGREADKDQNVSSQDMVKAIDARGKKVLYAKDLAETKKLILQNIQSNDIVLIMGAGDIYQVANKLVN